MPRAYKLFFLTTLALIAFAANSVIARLALIEGEAGPWGYTLVRVLSGAVLLAVLVGPNKVTRQGSWKGAFALCVYALFFSLAFLSLSTGTGTLIAFASVQLTMLGWGYFAGERLSVLQWAGFILAICGLMYLLSPGLVAPSVTGSVMMVAAGIGWGAYSIIGKGAGNPAAQTAGNFVRASPIILILTLTGFSFTNEPMPSEIGILLAIISGAVTSGLGYVIWYKVLKDLSVTRAGLAQSTVPVIAAIGGVIFVNELVTYRFLIASTIIMGGVGLATLSRPNKTCR